MVTVAARYRGDDGVKTTIVIMPYSEEGWGIILRPMRMALLVRGNPGGGLRVARRWLGMLGQEDRAAKVSRMASDPPVEWAGEG